MNEERIKMIFEAADSDSGGDVKDSDLEDHVEEQKNDVRTDTA